jgi:hypothetical protein
MTRESRLGINPGPLRVTGERVKEDHNAGRCKAITQEGLRCSRDAVEGAYCRQHATTPAHPTRPAPRQEGRRMTDITITLKYDTARWLSREMGARPANEVESKEVFEEINAALTAHRERKETRDGPR